MDSNDKAPTIPFGPDDVRAKERDIDALRRTQQLIELAIEATQEYLGQVADGQLSKDAVVTAFHRRILNDRPLEDVEKDINTLLGAVDFFDTWARILQASALQRAVREMREMTQAQRAPADTLA